MKNLFKNLMLVAVAAMAFTACTEENNEVNAVAKKTVIDFVASFADDTRSGFGDKVDGAYVSKWDGGESITAVAHTAEIDVEAYTSIDEEGAGNFTAEFATEDAISSVDFYVPSASWNTWSDEPTATVPNEQTPRATSVDPKAHILRGSVAVEGNVAQGNVVFAHEFAYGKLTLNLPEDFEAEEVMLTFIGTEENETQELTLNVADLEENVLWFTTTPMSVASFTVEATAANGAIATKEATPAGALNFEQGKVTAFSVSELEVSLFDYELVLTKVTAIDGNTISFEGATAQDRATIAFNPGLASIVAGTYEYVSEDWFNGGAPAYTSSDALEFYGNGSYYNLAAAYNASYDYYFGQSDIVVTDLGEGVVRIETLQKPSTSNGTKRVYIIFEGVLEVEEPEQPEELVFATATMEGDNQYDFYLYFYGDEPLKTLKLNPCSLDVRDWALPEGTFGLKWNQSGYFCAGIYSQYGGVNLKEQGSIKISIVEGQYFFEFSNLETVDGEVLEYASFLGNIEGLRVPNPEDMVVTEVNATVTWVYNSLDFNTTYGHVWNVNGGDAFSAQVTMDSRENATTSTSFTPGTYYYHAQYGDGNFSDNKSFTMRSIVIGGISYNSYDITGTIEVSKTDGVYTLTMELYKLVSGETGDKLATLVGTI